MALWKLKSASYKTPDDIFGLIEKGLKKIETRPINPKSDKKFKVGDVIELISLDSGRHLKKTIAFVHKYRSVGQLIENENEKAIFPGVTSKKELEHVYEELKTIWGAEYKTNLETYGIYALGME